MTSSFGPHGASFRSVVRHADGSEVPHGLSVQSSAGWLRAVDVHEHGRLVRHEDLHTSGFPFMSSWIQPDGSGSVGLGTLAGEHVHEGHVRDGQRWDGTFLVIEVVKGSFGPFRFALYSYRAGELIGRETFPFERFGLRAPDPAAGYDAWPFQPIGWPVPERFVVSE